jgi:hypothetical protein
MANGFVKAILLQEKLVFQGASPSGKITPPGYLKMLLNNSQPNIIATTMEPGNGTIRDVTIVYRPRTSEGQSGTTDDCSISATPGYLEADVPAPSFRHLARFFDDQTIARYQNEALQTVNIGQPPKPGGIMMEIWGQILDAANGLIADVNGDLLTAQAAAFGKNSTTGANTAKTINFPLSTVSNPLDQGMTLLETDIQDNEISVDNTVIVGAGLIAGAYRQIQNKTNNAADQNYPTNAPKFFWDPKAASKWGSNQFGVFEKNAVQFININKFNGPMGGDKMTTFLTTLNLPINITDSVGDTLQGLKFDVQIRYNNCPSEIEIAGVPTQVGRGWIVDLMMNYSQFNIPTDAYNAGDRLTGNNGTLRYTATNS